MKKVQFRFHHELNDFLPRSRRAKVFDYIFEGTPSIKHLIEANRVPHTEVGKIIANNKIVELSYLVNNGDQIEVYPSLMKLGENCIDKEGKLEKPQFLLDNHLGKLAVYLRMLGFDTLYRNDYQDEELAKVTGEDKRILLTRDRGLLMRRVIKKGYCVRALDPEKQLLEVAQRYHLFIKMEPFKRCLRCNSELENVEKREIIHRLEPLTRQYYHEFHICLSCDQVYWKGSHYDRMKEFINNLKLEEI